MQTFNASGKEIALHYVTGSVLSELNKNRETRVSGGGGQNNTAVHIRSTTTVHDQFFLKDDTGKEHAFQLTDFNLACREGHQLKVVWAIAKGKANGPYVAVQNFTTGDYFFQDKRLKDLLTPPTLQAIGALLLLFFTTMAIAGGLTAFVVVFIAFIICMIVYNSIAKSNVAAFKAFMKNAVD